MVPEGTANEGGSMNIGSNDTGDLISYPEVNIPSTGKYTVEYGVASVGGGGTLQFKKAGRTPVYGTINILATGNWQNWITISHTVYLKAGIATPVRGWNLNWFHITMPITVQAKSYSKMQGVVPVGTANKEGGINVPSTPST